MNPMDDDLIEVSEQEQNIDLIVDDEYDMERIDKYLASVLDDMSRSYIQKLIGEKRVSVNGRAVKANYKVTSGESVALCLPEPKDTLILPEDIDIDIIYEDEDIIVINKHKGLVVHPAPVMKRYISQCIIISLQEQSVGYKRSIKTGYRPSY